MDSKMPPNDEDCNVRDSSNVPTHGTMPKWLQDISQYVSNNLLQ